MGWAAESQGFSGTGPGSLSLLTSRRGSLRRLGRFARIPYKPAVRLCAPLDGDPHPRIASRSWGEGMGSRPDRGRDARGGRSGRGYRLPGRGGRRQDGNVDRFRGVDVDQHDNINDDHDRDGGCLRAHRGPGWPSGVPGGLPRTPRERLMPPPDRDRVRARKSPRDAATSGGRHPVKESKPGCRPETNAASPQPRRTEHG